MTIFGTQKTSQQLHDIIFKVIALQPVKTDQTLVTSEQLTSSWFCQNAALVPTLDGCSTEAAEANI